MGWSRGGLTSKIHAVVDSSGLPVRLALTTGEAHDDRLAAKLLSRLKPGSMLLADRGCYADWIRTLTANMEPGRISLQRAIEKTRSASARICTALEIWSNGSSTRSSSVGEWQHATPSSRPIILPSFNLRQSGYGCALMSPRPSGRWGVGFVEHMEGEGPITFQHACKLKLEGIVSKRKNVVIERASSNGSVRRSSGSPSLVTRKPVVRDNYGRVLRFCEHPTVGLCPGIAVTFKCRHMHQNEI
jgi:transposase